MVLAGIFGAPMAAGRAARPAPGLAAASRPIAFEENKGQSDASIRFTSRTRSYSLFLTDREAVLGLPSSSQLLRMEFLGASPLTEIHGENEQTARTYYARPGGQSLVSAPRFARTRYSGLYRGIDAVFHGNDGQVQFDFEVAPGADPGSIRLAFTGAESVATARTGELIVKVAGQVLRLKKPVLYQDVAGERRIVRGGYVLIDNRTVAFHTARYDRSIPLVIDPTIAYATYLGSPADERVIAVEANAAGEAYVFGATMDRGNFPATTPGLGRLSAASEYLFRLEVQPERHRPDLFGCAAGHRAADWTNPLRRDDAGALRRGQRRLPEHRRFLRQDAAANQRGAVWRRHDFDHAAHGARGVSARAGGEG